MNLQKFPLAACVVALIMPLAACTSGSDLRATTTRAITSTLDAESWREQGTSSYSADGETQETTWEGEVAAPDRSRVKITTETGTWCEATRIGEQTYVRASDMPESGAAVREVACVMLPITEVLEPLDLLIDLEQLPDEKIDNVQCLHYRGRMDMDAFVQREEAGTGSQLPPELWELMRRGSMEVELWVGKDDYLIRQMKRLDHMPEWEAGTAEASWIRQTTVIRFYDFNEPISIEPPAEDSGGATFRTFKSPTMPVDQLLMDPRACVAVVQPVERGAVYGVTVEQRSDFGVYVEDDEYDGDWPFTPVTLRVLEPLSGELPETIVVWEERGTILGLSVDSSDPYLEPGQRGLLILASVQGRWFPILFAEVDVDGEIPALNTSVDELRQLLGHPS
jgi:hypothetical protein